MRIPATARNDRVEDRCSLGLTYAVVCAFTVELNNTIGSIKKTRPNLSVPDNWKTVTRPYKSAGKTTM